MPIFSSFTHSRSNKKGGGLKLCKICIRTYIGKKCKVKKCFQCHNTLLHLKIKAESNIVF